MTAREHAEKFAKDFGFTEPVLNALVKEFESFQAELYRATLIPAKYLDCIGGAQGKITTETNA